MFMRNNSQMCTLHGNQTSACIATLSFKTKSQNTKRNYEKYTNKWKTIRNINDIKMNNDDGDYCCRNCARHKIIEEQPIGK